MSEPIKVGDLVQVIKHPCCGGYLGLVFVVGAKSRNDEASNFIGEDMERKYGSNEEALAVAKEAMWLAWQASRVVGLGVLQDKPGAQREEVLKQTFRPQSDYAKQNDLPLEGSADYVFGRMMKTHFRIKGNVVSYGDGEPRGDYQSWAYTYRTYDALMDAAETAVLEKAA